MNNKDFQELTSLFFGMRQTIRANLPDGQADPNAWMRCETLRFIAENDAPTMREIAKYLRVTAPSATSLIRKLFSLGWIERKQSGSDKRVVRISLTAKGKKGTFPGIATGPRGPCGKVFRNCRNATSLHLKRALRNLQAIFTLPDNSRDIVFV